MRRAADDGSANRIWWRLKELPLAQRKYISCSRLRLLERHDALAKRHRGERAYGTAASLGEISRTAAR